MPNILSNVKDVKKSKLLRQRNNAVRSSIKTAIKKVLRTGPEPIAPEERQASFREAQKKIAKSVSKGVLHKNTAARKISRLSRNLNKLV